MSGAVRRQANAKTDECLNRGVGARKQRDGDHFETGGGTNKQPISDTCGE